MNEYDSNRILDLTKKINYTLTKKIEDAGLRLNSSGKKSVLCRQHYKEWKKETKDERELERARYDRT